MRVGIERSSVVIPRHRVRGSDFAAAWGTSARKGARAVCFHDEDALTLGVEAALALVGASTRPPEAIIAASLSSPFVECSTAIQIAAACDLRPASSVDLAGSRRAGVAGLTTAHATVTSGRAANALVVATDARSGEPGSAVEAALGHGAVSFFVGTHEPGAEILGVGGAFADYLETFRVDGDRHVRVDASRLASTEAAVTPVGEAVRRALDAAGVKDPREVAHLALDVDERTALAIAKACGIRVECIVDPGAVEFGDIGCAFAPASLCRALERAKPGELLVAAAHGGGAEAVVLRATEFIEHARPSETLASVVARGAAIPSYAKWLKWRGILGEPDAAPAMSSALLYKDAPMITRLCGYRCKSCGLVAYPPGKLCQRCRSPEVGELRLSRRGTVFTMTRDRLFGSPDRETAMLVVDLDDGARVFVQGTDAEATAFEIGTKVDLVFRRIHFGDDRPNYYWKARPANVGGAA